MHGYTVYCIPIPPHPPPPVCFVSVALSLADKAADGGGGMLQFWC